MQLNRCNSMKRAYEFAHVRKVGTSSPGRFLVFSSATLPAGEELGTSRVGIIVTKRVGNAVTRNLLRRRIREIVRAQLCESPLTHGRYIVIILRKPAVDAAYTELEENFIKSHKRLLGKFERQK